MYKITAIYTKVFKSKEEFLKDWKESYEMKCNNKTIAEITYEDCYCFTDFESFVKDEPIVIIEKE